MNADTLPLDVLAWLALGAWFVYVLIIASETKWNRRDDRHRSRAARDVSSQRGEDGIPDHEELRDQDNGSADDPADDPEQRRIVHGRRVAPR